MQLINLMRPSEGGTKIAFRSIFHVGKCISPTEKYGFQVPGSRSISTEASDLPAGFQKSVSRSSADY